ncbi:cell division protein FtsL [Azospirillum himalayense]|uniref:Periplasmic protein TonB n=1 Tax=Azospirillum himalayense TaxID=654847 RepID=A0ABW0G3S1_9PROT
MKYKSALFWGGLIAAAGFVLFETSYEVQELEEKLGSLNRKIMVEQEAIQVLKAEWSFLNDPTRLENLSREHLALQPTEARQFVAMTIVPMRPSPTVAPEEAPLPPMVRNQTPGKAPNVATASTGDSVVGGGAIVQGSVQGGVQGGPQGGVIIPASASPIKPAPIKPSAIVPASAKVPPLPSAAKAAPAPVVTTKPTEVATKPPVTSRTLAPPPAARPQPQQAGFQAAPPPAAPAQHDSIGLLVARLGANR